MIHHPQEQCQGGGAKGVAPTDKMLATSYKPVQQGTGVGVAGDTAAEVAMTGREATGQRTP